MTIGTLLTTAVKELTEQPEVFLQYLCTAAANEEQSFVNQLLIFAQAPNSSVCADAQEWQDCGCQPIPEKAIALLDEESGYTIRRRLVWNEKSVSGDASRLEKWNLNPLFDAQEADALHSYCPMSAETLPDALLAAAEKGVEWKLEDTYDTFRQNTGRKAMYEMTQFQMHPEDQERMEEEMDWLQTFLTAAVHFQLLVRCNFDPFEQYAEESFVKTVYCDMTKYPSGFLSLLEAIYEIAHDIFLYLRDIAKEYPELLPYQLRFGGQKPLVSVAKVEDVVFPGEANPIHAAHLEEMQSYRKEEYLRYLMDDDLVEYLTVSQE